MGAVNQLLSKHNVEVRRGRVDIHRDEAIVERFNRTLAERLFGHQYGVEMRLPDDKRSTEWVARLPAVISALNKEVTQLTGQKLVETIKEKTVPSKPSTPYLRPVGVNEKKLPSGLSVRYLYQPGEPVFACLVVAVNDFVTILRVTFSTPVPVAAVVLKYSLRCMVVPVDRCALNPTLATMPANCVMNVNFPPLGFLVKPPKRFFGSSMVWIESLLEGCLRGFELFARAIDYRFFLGSKFGNDVEGCKLV